MKLKRRQLAMILGVIVGVVLLVILILSLSGGSAEIDGGVVGMTTAEKNAQRQDDMKRLLAKSREYQSSRGTLPGNLTEWRQFMSSYLPDFRDPDGTAYELVQACNYNTEYCVMPDALGWEQNKHQIYVAWHAACANGALAGYRKSDAVVAYMALEDARPVCVDR